MPRLVVKPQVNGFQMYIALDLIKKGLSSNSLSAQIFILFLGLCVCVRAWGEGLVVKFAFFHYFYAPLCYDSAMNENKHRRQRGVMYGKGVHFKTTRTNLLRVSVRKWKKKKTWATPRFSKQERTQHVKILTGFGNDREAIVP